MTSAERYAGGERARVTLAEILQSHCTFAGQMHGQHGQMCVDHFHMAFTWAFKLGGGLMRPAPPR